jgi:type III pantothenate kinase
MNLCIDWGNTRVKAAIFQDDKLVKDYNFSGEEALTRLMELIEQHSPKAAILCSVVNHPPELKVLIQEHTQLVILNSNTPLPVMNAYHSPESLGMDRLALAVGANAAYPEYNNLVISAGTAITYNFVHKNRIFRGGNITPGMDLRFRSLHEYTDKLPLVSAEGDLVLLGYDTETSIRSGVIMGIVAEIEGMINYYREQYSDFNAVLTGGNAALFADKLKNRIFADSQLLLKGLNTILRHNVR